MITKTTRWNTIHNNLVMMIRSCSNADDNRNVDDNEDDYCSTTENVTVTVAIPTK